MSTMTAHPPRYDTWPLPVQHAMRLRGALIPCGPGMRGAGWPDNPKVRLATLGAHLEHGLVAAYLTAAWVWDASPTPGAPLSVAAPAGSARWPVSPEAHRFEFRFTPGDTMKLGNFGITSPRRTLLDLIHRPDIFDASTHEACRNLLNLLRGTREQVVEEIESTRRPHARLARERLHALLAHRALRLP